ncbi:MULTISPECIES: riboflavin kinase [Micrococcaceae]|uniref:riboflavin kinase n=1 Tax=Micrococcaceae TaxID=1268 RepID=UPI00105FB60E|nr:riboflavin kinase [Arthrobacter sp. JUb115]TDU21740.1 riboflavin kinase/FMN adenylyltransferase [Arthrobacter sp. JUb115]
MHAIEGIVEHGDARGRELGFRTANIPMLQDDQLDGVWGAEVLLPDGRQVPACVSIGRRATFYRTGGQVLLEAHLLDFSGDLYGQHLVVRLLEFQRPQIEYADAGTLVEQLHRDVAETRRAAQLRESVLA